MRASFQTVGEHEQRCGGDISNVRPATSDVGVRAQQDLGASSMRRLSMNEATTRQWSFEEDVRAYAAAGYQGIGAWRNKIEACGLDRAVQLLREHNLGVANLCAAGQYTDPPTEEGLKRRIADTRKAIETAARIEAETLIILVGPIRSFTSSQAFKVLGRALEEVVPYAERNGVRLALEPTHPMYRADTSFLMTLAEAIDVCEAFESPCLGVYIDVYHVGWDNTVYEQIKRARGRILGVQLSDWKRETKSLEDWGLPGEGVMPLRALLEAVEAAGWDGLYDVEVFSDTTEPGDYPRVLRHCREWFDAVWSE